MTARAEERRETSLVAFGLMLAIAAGNPPAAGAVLPSTLSDAPIPGETSTKTSSIIPLTDHERELFASVRADPEPETTVRGQHYVVSNEQNQQQFKSAIEGLGGVGIGVGAEQNYLFAGWARSEVLVLMDFDQAVVDLHAVYRVAFLNAATPEEFCALWQKENRQRLAGLVRDAYAGSSRPKAALRVMREARYPVGLRLDKLKEHFTSIGVPTFVTDPAEYAHVRALYQTDRVLQVRGDLKGDRTLRDLAARLKEQERVVRWIYLSNAEQYFQYTPKYRRNLLGLPIDDKSVVLRTRPFRFDYAYVVQSFQNFALWLGAPHVMSVRAIVPRSLLKGEEPLVEIASLPPPRMEKRARRGRPGTGE